MGLTLQELAEVAQAQLRGDPGRMVDRVATLQDADEGRRQFSRQSSLQIVIEDHAGVCGDPFTGGCQ